jgi:hypothetical protein
MAFLCQRHDGNLLFPHPRPSPATTVFVFAAATRAAGGDPGKAPVVPTADQGSQRVQCCFARGLMLRAVDIRGWRLPSIAGRPGVDLAGPRGLLIGRFGK